MKVTTDSAEAVEPERYEFNEFPAYHFEIDRRDFAKLLGAGILILLVARNASAQESRNRRGGDRPAAINAWLHLGESGGVTVFTGKTEVGQNIRTSLAQAVAEELPIPFESIRLVMADTDLTPYDAGTFGSRSTPDMAPQLRRAAAATRETLLDLAAAHFDCPRSELSLTATGVVRTASGATATFADLTNGSQLTLEIPEDLALKSAPDWKISGTSVPKVDGRFFVTGRHLFTSDLTLPNLLHGKILRGPALKATLTDADTQAAESLPGVTVIRDGDFLGVTAPSVHLAERAIAAIEATWSRQTQPSNSELFALLRKDAPPRPAGPEPGEDETRHDRTYTIAYIATAPLEPRAAVAEWVEGKLTVWTGTQRPFGVRRELAETFHLPEDRVRVIVPDTGSGYGGKHTGEAAVEAARLAKNAGRPVKIVWTRSEEFTWAYFRPAGVIDITSTVRKDGRITGWAFDNFNSGRSGLRSPYDVTGQREDFHPSPAAPLRQGSYRALASAANTFARERHVDDLARSVSMDPLAFRLKNLTEQRMRAVLEAAAEAFAWGRQLADGRGAGLACGTEKGSFVATCAEVAVDRATGSVKILRTVTAFECGAVVNPEHLKNQIEGCLVMGLGGALFEEILFKDGVIGTDSFATYRVPKFRDTPPMEIILLDRKDLPSAGAGETPIIAIAPAIGNAILAATGRALDTLPMALQELQS